MCGGVEAVDLEATDLGGIVQFSRMSSVSTCINKVMSFKSIVIRGSKLALYIYTINLKNY